MVVIVNAAVVVGLWLRHGGLGSLDQPGGTLMAAGQLTALIGTYAVLVQLLLMSRIGWLERHIGFDRLAVWHRWTGFATGGSCGHGSFVIKSRRSTRDKVESHNGRESQPWEIEADRADVDLGIDLPAAAPVDEQGWDLGPVPRCRIPLLVRVELRERRVRST